jgi:MFS family permease
VSISWSDWRTSFIVCGAGAIAWAGLWWFFFKEDPREAPDARARHLEGLTVSLPDRKTPIPLWALTKRMVPVTVVTFTYGWSYWIFVSWLPLYFANRHHTDLKQSALLTSLLFLAGLIGNIVGGVGSDAVLKRSGSRRLARCGIVAASLVGTALFLIPCLFINDLTVVVALLSVSIFFFEMTIAPMYAITMDITKEYAAFGSAYVVLGIALSGIVSPVVFGWLIDVTGNWNLPFATGVAILLTGAATVMNMRPDVPLVHASAR